METALDDFEVKSSNIPVAGKGVFIRRNIPQDVYLYLKPRAASVGVSRSSSEIPPEYIGYCIARENDIYLCPADFNNMEPVWYLNHSSNPNAEQRSDGYYSLRALKAGEETFIDYNTLGEPEDKKENFYKS